MISFLTSPNRWMTFGRLLVIDVDDDRQRQGRLVGVLRDQVDRAQALVVPMRLGAAGDPVQDEVRRRHQDDVAGVGVERILARPERLLEHAPLALADPLSVAERLPRDVLSAPAVIAHHDAHVADRHDRLGDRLDRGEPSVDEVGAVGERDVLQPAPTTRAEERLGVLVIVVEILVVAVGPDAGRDDLAGRQRRAVVHRDDPHAVHQDRLARGQRVGRLDRSPDDHRVERVVLAQLVLPADQRLELLAIPPSPADRPCPRRSP